MAENYKEGYMQCVAQLSEARAAVATLREQLAIEGRQTAYWQELWAGQHAAKLDHWDRADAAEGEIAALRAELAEQVGRADENLAALERVTGWNAALRERAERAEERIRDVIAGAEGQTAWGKEWERECHAAERRAALLEGLLREVIHALMQAGMGSGRMKTRRHLQSQAESFLGRLAALADAPRAGACDG